jgi:hypothetical protein
MNWTKRLLLFLGFTASRDANITGQNHPAVVEFGQRILPFATGKLHNFQ